MSNRTMINSLLNNYEMQIHTLTAEVERLKALPETRWFDCPEGKQCPYTIPPKPVVWVRKAISRGDYFRVWQNGELRFSQYHTLDCWRTIYEDVAEVREWTEPTTCPTCNGKGVKP